MQKKEKVWTFRKRLLLSAYNVMVHDEKQWADKSVENDGKSCRLW